MTKEEIYIVENESRLTQLAMIAHKDVLNAFEKYTEDNIFKMFVWCEENSKSVKEMVECPLSIEATGALNFVKLLCGETFAPEVKQITNEILHNRWNKCLDRVRSLGPINAYTEFKGGITLFDKYPGKPYTEYLKSLENE